jgi:hypothetical protein
VADQVARIVCGAKGALVASVMKFRPASGSVLAQALMSISYSLMRCSVMPMARKAATASGNSSAERLWT